MGGGESKPKVCLTRGTPREDCRELKRPSGPQKKLTERRSSLYIDKGPKNTEKKHFKE